ncbi:MAG: hypothetical protein JNM78_16870 [Cyclobacteriaceae bacterium]|nr:hypothetical protein [Cyclobacteriaceae bacterium]
MRHWLLGLLILCGCTKKEEVSNVFSEGKILGVVDKKLEEASGLVASVANPGYFWSHNDGGNPAEVFLMNEKAEIVMTCTLEGISNRDWEDIAISVESDTSYIYIGDIGDNEAKFPYKIIYRFVEPVLITEKLLINHFDTLVFNLSDGARDTEALMIDPITQNLFIISKREKMVRLYQVSSPFIFGDTTTAEFITGLPFEWIVASDISADGKEVLIKDYDNVFYWKRLASETIPELLKTKPSILKYEREPQGEAIAWRGDGSGYYTLSETAKGITGRLFYYQRK